MIYLSAFRFPSQGREAEYFTLPHHTCYTSLYPFQVLGDRVERLDFAPVTVLYGGNGSGKTTVLNVIAEKLGLSRRALYNRSDLFPGYLGLCEAELVRPLPEKSAILTSDDVFQDMLDRRALNEGVDRSRAELLEEYRTARREDFRLLSLEGYADFRRKAEALGSTGSAFVRGHLAKNVRTFSNGESAFRYFLEQVTEDGLFLLDEPENSLSAQRQRELAGFLADAARFYRCQLLLSTHSPFLLAIPGARVYDLDRDPAQVCDWTELPQVRAYYEFFREHEEELGKGVSE